MQISRGMMKSNVLHKTRSTDPVLLGQDSPRGATGLLSKTCPVPSRFRGSRSIQGMSVSPEQVP